MKAPALAVLAVLVGCIDATSQDSSQSAHALPSDSHYVVFPDGYSSPEECIKTDEQPFSCIDSLSLCKSGRAGWRIGDIVYEGRYSLQPPMANITFEDGRTMQFDVADVIEPASPSVSWMVDTADRWETLQFDNIDCSQP